MQSCEAPCRQPLPRCCQLPIASGSEFPEPPHARYAAWSAGVPTNTWRGQCAGPGVQNEAVFRSSRAHSRQWPAVRATGIREERRSKGNNPELDTRPRSVPRPPVRQMPLGPRRISHDSRYIFGWVAAKVLAVLMQDLALAGELLGRAAHEVPVLGETGRCAERPPLPATTDADRRVRRCMPLGSLRA